MAFELPVLTTKLSEVLVMTNSPIPWHIFHDAIEAQNPYCLNPWLERWRFMDRGVVLFDAIKAPIETSIAMLKAAQVKAVADDSCVSIESLQST